MPTQIRLVSHRKKIDLATMTDVPVLELGHCQPRVLQALQHQLDGAGDDPLPVVGSHHLLTQSRSIRRPHKGQLQEGSTQGPLCCHP